MASYLFKCADCGSEHIEFRKMGDAPETVRCRDCGGDSRRKYTPPTTIIR